MIKAVGKKNKKKIKIGSERKALNYIAILKFKYGHSKQIFHCTTHPTVRYSSTTYIYQNIFCDLKKLKHKQILNFQWMKYYSSLFLITIIQHKIVTNNLKLVVVEEVRRIIESIGRCRNYETVTQCVTVMNKKKWNYIKY